MRTEGRVQFPDFDLLLSETNKLLSERGLPECSRIEAVADGDTANPNVIGFANERKYVVKVT